MIRTLKTRLDRKTLQIIYFSFIRPLIEYTDVAWDTCPRYLKNQLDKIQIDAARIVTQTVCSKLVSLRNPVSAIHFSTYEELEK